MPVLPCDFPSKKLITRHLSDRWRACLNRLVALFELFLSALRRSLLGVFKTAPAILAVISPILAYFPPWCGVAKKMRRYVALNINL